MEATAPIVYCSDTDCVFNSSSGYYGICNNKMTINEMPAGIKRVHCESCKNSCKDKEITVDIKG